MIRIALVVVGLIVLAAELSANDVRRLSFGVDSVVTFTTSTVVERFTDFNEQRVLDSTIVMRSHELSPIDAGWQLTTIVTSNRRVRNGQPVDDALAPIIAQLRIVANLDSTGRMTAIDGYERLYPLIDSSFDAETAVGLRRLVDPVVLANNDRSIWNGRLANLIGRQMQIDDVIRDEGIYTMPNGREREVYSRSVVIDTLRIRGRWHGEVLVQSATSAMAMSKLSGIGLLDVVKQWAIPDSVWRFFATNRGDMTFQNRLRFDLNSLLPHSEDGERLIETIVPMESGEWLPYRATERRSVSYRYQ